MNRPVSIIVAVLLALIAAAPLGCDTMPMDTAERQAAEAATSSRVAALESLEAEAIAAEAPPEALAEIAGALQEAREQSEALAGALARMDAAQAGSRATGDLVGAAVGLAPIPGWASTLAALIGGAVATWAAVGKDAKAARQLVNAIDAAKAKDSTLAAALKASRNTIRANLDLAVARRIDDLRL
jgi:hypothetical protein